MNGLAEIIPIESRRRHRKRGTPPPQVAEPELTPQVRRRRLLAFLGGVVVLIMALLIINRAVLPRAVPPPPLSQETRQGLYQRALDDVKAACALPQARSGFLRQHCVDQARFLQQMAECTGDCAALSRDVLTRR